MLPCQHSGKRTFNEDYEAFVAAVRDLLVPIFADVDRYGLKWRYLKKHTKAVDRFYNAAVEGPESGGELVERYKKRFARYRESLFLFLTDNGIPWNNNMAERPLRHLVVQMKISRCMSTVDIPKDSGMIDRWEINRLNGGFRETCKEPCGMIRNGTFTPVRFMSLLSGTCEKAPEQKLF